MKILSYKVENDRIIFKTNNNTRPDFNYDVNKFNNLAEAIAEIQKSISFEGKRKEKLKKKLDKIKEDMEK